MGKKIRRGEVPEALKRWAEANNQDWLVPTAKRKKKYERLVWTVPKAEKVGIILYPNRKFYLTADPGSHASGYVSFRYFLFLIEHDKDFEIIRGGVDVTVKTLARIYTDFERERLSFAPKAELIRKLKRMIT